jgi:hypothetical protein
MEIPCTNPIEMWPIDRPKDNPDNPRVHPDEQVLGIAKSVETHGLNGLEFDTLIWPTLIV